MSSTSNLLLRLYEAEATDSIVGLGKPSLYCLEFDWEITMGSAQEPRGASSDL